MPRTGRPRITWVREDFFDELTPEALYWLGFILADGSVSLKPRWLLTVCLAAKDSAHLEALHRVLGGTINPTIAGAIRLSVCSKRVVTTLGELGVVPRKSYQPADLDRSLATPAMLRGMFDGDGCLHVTRRGYLQTAFCGHPRVVRWFVEVLGVQTNGLRLRANTLYAQWTSERRAVEVARRLYVEDGAPRLARKARIAGGFADATACAS